MATDKTASGSVCVNSEYFLEMLNELKQSTKYITSKTTLLMEMFTLLHSNKSKKLPARNGFLIVNSDKKNVVPKKELHRTSQLRSTFSYMSPRKRSNREMKIISPSFGGYFLSDISETPDIRIVRALLLVNSCL